MDEEALMLQQQALQQEAQRLQALATEKAEQARLALAKAEALEQDAEDQAEQERVAREKEMAHQTEAARLCEQQRIDNERLVQEKAGAAVAAELEAACIENERLAQEKADAEAAEALRIENERQAKQKADAAEVMDLIQAQHEVSPCNVQAELPQARQPFSNSASTKQWLKSIDSDDEPSSLVAQEKTESDSQAAEALHIENELERLVQVKADDEAAEILHIENYRLAQEIADAAAAELETSRLDNEQLAQEKTDAEATSTCTEQLAHEKADAAKAQAVAAARQRLIDENAHLSALIEDAERASLAAASQNQQEVERLEHVALSELMRFLLVGNDGVLLTKHGRQGAPKKRLMKTIGGTNPATAAIAWDDSILLLRNVQLIVAGKTTPVLTGTTVPSSVCFSVIDDERSLDLECASTPERDQWVQNLTRWHNVIRDQLEGATGGRRRRASSVSAEQPLFARVGLGHLLKAEAEARASQADKPHPLGPQFALKPGQIFLAMQKVQFKFKWTAPSGHVQRIC